MNKKNKETQSKKIIISYKQVNTPVGKMMVAETDKGICFLGFGDKEEPMFKELKSEYKDAEIKKMKGESMYINMLTRYFKRENIKFELPLDIQGTVFQKKVWKYLQSIPLGGVKSYTEVARGIGKPKAVRAVASACARNNISIIIPCHRVIRNNGDLAGYRWGLEKKRMLLILEKSI